VRILLPYIAESNLTGTEHGPIKLSTFLIPYRVGDIVDIKANAAQQKGMPHKFYHGFVILIPGITTL
jgi:large subunit ribosomal protein L21e